MTLAGLRLAIGTLTVFPVRVSDAGRAAARGAMLWAPAVGLAVGAVQYAVYAAVRWAAGDGLLAASLAVAAGAALTRGLHLDGLADVADGLGSGRPAAGALEVMKRSDIGPFGVITLLLTLLVQVAALAAASGHGAAGPAIVVAAAAGRTALPWACRRGVPAARPDGLGAMVAGTVPPAGALASTAAASAVCAAGTAAVLGPAGTGRAAGAIGAVAAIAVSLAAAEIFLRHLLRRLGGVTGDVLGALVELSATVALTGMAVVAAVLSR